MIILKKLSFDNLFSFGRNNVLELSSAPITQLVGKNGHGKSSIALILEEGLYNKNSKGIKKANILNRNIKDKAYNISIEFEKDGDTFIVNTTRSATQSVTLLKNGEDVSAHTATATFKLIEDIIGMDHESFSQLVYQSSGSSLGFLTATDTNRKKFLISLLKLDRYTEAFEVFKKAAKSVQEQVTAEESAVSTITSWIDRNKKLDLEEMDTLEVPSINITSMQEEVAKLVNSLNNITSENSIISKNNQYKSNMDSIDIDSIKNVQKPSDVTAYNQEVGSLEKTIRDAKALITKMSSLGSKCPTCMQDIDGEKLSSLLDSQKLIEAEASKALTKINETLAEHNKEKARYNSATKLKAEYEQYHSLYDPSKPTELIDAESIKLEVSSIRNEITKSQKIIEDIELKNANISKHNAKVQAIKEQMQQMQVDLNDHLNKLDLISTELMYLQLLQKTFSTSGLVAYKIECMVKDLEDMVNTYLADLSDGRFQLTFSISSSDKLNVVITDNGKDIEITALSSGELARVNTATLLAIRKLMQSLSNSKINLLILDETVENLDVEGKERLIEVLVEEEHLNTFLVSHGFSHPLLEKIMVIKEHNISRIE